jgi:DNA-binding Lrp family transcriptional regulator
MREFIPPNDLRLHCEIGHFLLRVVTADLAAYERFLKDPLTRIRGVSSIKSSFALKHVKYSTRVTAENDC